MKTKLLKKLRKNIWVENRNNLYRLRLSKKFVNIMKYELSHIETNWYINGEKKVLESYYDAMHKFANHVHGLRPKRKIK